jgi:hypothetical protein
MQATLGAWAGAQEAARREAKLDKQRQVSAAAAKTGLSVMLVAAAWCALRYGRVWEVHAACGGGGRLARAAAAAPRRWWAAPGVLPAGAAASARGVASAYQYCLCFVENMGEALIWDQTVICSALI